MAETIPTIPDQRLASHSRSGPGPGSAASTLALPPSAHVSAIQAMSSSSSSSSSPPLPRVTIRFCTQCKWMLRAAYFAQELLSTFSTSLGEVALQPTTGGIFIVEIYYPEPKSELKPITDINVSEHSTPKTDTELNAGPTTRHRVLWDRKIDGGFPETKELKRRVRDVIEPGRNLGHVDRDYPRQQQQQPEQPESKAASYNTLKGGNMPETKEQQQERQGQQGRQQPPGPRWPQLNNNNNNNNNDDNNNKPSSSQPIEQEHQTVATTDPQSKPSTRTNTSTGPQGKVPKDLGPYPRQNTSTDANSGPVYEPRMPGGGIMPVVPPVAPSSRIQEALSLQAGSQSHKEQNQNQNECEDCQ